MQLGLFIDSVGEATIGVVCLKWLRLSCQSQRVLQNCKFVRLECAHMGSWGYSNLPDFWSNYFNPSCCRQAVCGDISGMEPVNTVGLGIENLMISI